LFVNCALNSLQNWRGWGFLTVLNFLFQAGYIYSFILSLSDYYLTWFKYNLFLLLEWYTLLDQLFTLFNLNLALKHSQLDLLFFVQIVLVSVCYD